MDDFLPDKEFMNEDFIRVKRQELENMNKAELIDYIKKFNAKWYQLLYNKIFCNKWEINEK